MLLQIIMTKEVQNNEEGEIVKDVIKAMLPDGVIFSCSISAMLDHPVVLTSLNRPAK